MPTGKGIQVELPREHAALKATGKVELYRPSAAGADRSYPLALDAEGSQWLPADGITPGLWKVRLHWKVANEDYFADRELVIRDLHVHPIGQPDKEILRGIALGQSNKEIARELGMAEPTVKGHLVTVFRVLRVRNRAEAVSAGQVHLRLLTGFR